MRDAIAPKLVETKKAVGLVSQMIPTKPDFAGATAAAAVDFVPGGGVFSGNGIRIGGDNIFSITQFQSKAAMFKRALEDHDRMTNKVDKEELDQLLGGNADLLDGNQRFAVLYQHEVLLDHVKEERADDQYLPPNGSMVKITAFKVDEDGNVSYQSLNNNEERKISVRNVIPIKSGEILKTAGANNALTRYARRVNTLKFYAQDIDKSMTGIEDNLNKLAERVDAPIIQVTSAEKPAEEAPAKKPAAEEAPAEEAPAEEAPAE